MNAGRRQGLPDRVYLNAFDKAATTFVNRGWSIVAADRDFGFAEGLEGRPWNPEHNGDQWSYTLGFGMGRAKAKRLAESGGPQ